MTQNRPPKTFYDKDTEEALLGCFLIDNNTFGLAINYLNEKDFYFEKNRFLFKQMLKIYEKQGSFDYIILYPLVKEQKISSQELLELTEKPSTVQMAGNYIKYVKILSCERQIQSFALKLRTEEDIVNAPGLSSKIESLKTELNIIKNEISLEEDFNFKQDLSETIRITEEMTKTKTLAFSTGINTFDKYFGGFHRQRIYILGARPGHGKTSFLTWFTTNISKNYKVLFITPEMAKRDLILRMLCSQSNVNNQVIENPKLLTDKDWGKIVKASAQMYDNKIAIYDKKCTVQHVNFLAQKVKPDILILDYLQHMSFKSIEFRAMEINNIMNEFKDIAKENNCSVIIASQITRLIEERQSKEPVSSDYKSSGAIEEGGDMAMFLLWPYKFNQYRNPETHDEWGEEDKHNITMVISKNRFGPTGKFKLRFNYENYSFGASKKEDLTEEKDN